MARTTGQAPSQVRDLTNRVAKQISVGLLSAAESDHEDNVTKQPLGSALQSALSYLRGGEDIVAVIRSKVTDEVYKWYQEVQRRVRWKRLGMMVLGGVIGALGNLVVKFVLG